MNPIVQAISSFIIALNRFIDSLSLQTIQNIRRGFFFTIFVMCIIGIIIGINMGKKSAKIRSAPFAEFVNDTFKIDLNREKESADFSEMLENEIIKESDINNFEKAEFPVREQLKPQYDKAPIDSDNRVSEPDIMTKPYKSETPIDEDLNRTKTDNEKSVRPLEKNLTDENKGDIIINRNTENENQNKIIESEKDKSPVRILEKDKTVKPEIYNKDSGIISQ
ncbi:MAG TPA: hypothetical protein PK358_02145 [Spirochaetota bacterium]|nr:hypothetical protein [Spirochaetota bacterium]HPJ33606.1 hypothetical protein [Spirochaetota bacterium]